MITPKDMRLIPPVGKKTAVGIRTAQLGPSIHHGDRMTAARAAARYVAAALFSTSSLASCYLGYSEAGGCGGSGSSSEGLGLTDAAPVCPFCNQTYGGAILNRDSQVILTCDSCERRYEWVPGSGCYPLENDLGLQVSYGPLGPKVIVGSSRAKLGSPGRRGLSILSWCMCLATLLILLLILLNSGPVFFG